jgi:putative tryptophan/tyrosine transport system substrate-binding protein
MRAQSHSTRGAPLARRSFLGAGLGLGLTAALSQAARTGPNQTLVVWNSEVASYAEALEGIRQGFGDQAERGLAVIDLKTDPKLAGLESPAGAGPRNAIAVGLEAYRALQSHTPQFPVFTTMVHRADGVPNAMNLDVPLTSLMEELATLVPGKKRLGVLESASTASQIKGSVADKATQLGYTLMVAEASRPDSVSAAFLSFRRKVDLVVVTADRNVYDSAGIATLLKLSLESALPVVLFAPSLVRAGGAIGIYPDYVEVGVQTAEALLAGKAAEAPRKLTVALNQRTLRLSGCKVKDTRANGENCLVFR